tara:strand:- start:2363 stop:2740 length:378 start_codon:yes stop_codon:yes gene_type:complete
MYEAIPEINEDGFRYFTKAEFACKHTGKNETKDSFIHSLDQLRHVCGFPFTITSGYRDKTHPEEIGKAVPGQHNRGVAADVRVTGGMQRRKIVEMAFVVGFTGIGVSKGFVHLDKRNTQPMLWSY